MRKIDYVILADILRKEISEARAAADSATDSGLRITAQTMENVLANVSRKFAKGAAVDKANFLKACGL